MYKTFEINSGKMVISDPCYSTDTWCMGIVENVKKGIWETEVIYKDDNPLDIRIASLVAWNKEASIYKDVQSEVHYAPPLPFINGVDSGQLGFFDFDHYRNDESAKDLPKYNFSASFLGKGDNGDEWYKACCKLTLSEEGWGTLPNGVVSSSGYGDGSYTTFGLKDSNGEYVAFITHFIFEEEDDEDEWFDEEEENDED